MKKYILETRVQNIVGKEENVDNQYFLPSHYIFRSIFFWVQKRVVWKGFYMALVMEYSMSSER